MIFADDLKAGCPTVIHKQEASSKYKLCCPDSARVIEALKNIFHRSQCSGQKDLCSVQTVDRTRMKQFG